MTPSRSYRSSALIFYAALISGTVSAAEPNNPDPWEGFNRNMFAFNETLDTYFMKPVTRSYLWVSPNFVERGVSNFFGNLRDVVTIPNQLLQGKLVPGLGMTGRVILNSTLGIGGLWDVATPMGVSRKKEDFGQTLGVWHIPSGPYLVLPFFGPSTVRDAGGKLVDTAFKPNTWQPGDPGFRLGLTAFSYVDVRASLLGKESAIQGGDKYTTLRDVYLQARKYDTADGDITDDFVETSDDSGEFLDESF